MSTHFWNEDIETDVAFVLSAPGEEEEANGKPAAGETGSQLDKILIHLNKINPKLFPSINRYDYKITNASDQVFYAAKDNGDTEDEKSKILNKNNIERVRTELHGSKYVILCGLKAQLLSAKLSDFKLINIYHPGAKGLRQMFPNSHCGLKELKKEKGAIRDEKRYELCALEIIKQIEK